MSKGREREERGEEMEADGWRKEGEKHVPNGGSGEERGKGRAARGRDGGKGRD